MATWTNTGASARLYDGARTYGYIYLQYDADSVGTSRSCRLWFDFTGSGSLSVTLRDVTIGGSNKGNVDVGNADKVVWSGSLTGGASYTFSWYCNWYSYGRYNYTSSSGTVPVGAIAPSGLTATLDSFTDTTATISVALSSYGTPASEANRYIEGAVFVGSTYGDNSTYRYETATAANSNTFTVTNSSRTGSNQFNIMGNTQYHYGAYANNTALSTSIVSSDTFVTLPAYITNVTVNDVGGGDMVISVLHNTEGSADTVYTEYSYDQVTWVSVPETFHLTVHSATTLYLRRENNSGVTPVRSVSIVPATTVKLYGSVNDQSKEIRKLYGSVNSQAVRIRKLYGSVNGRSKLIFEDNS